MTEIVRIVLKTYNATAGRFALSAKVFQMRTVDMGMPYCSTAEKVKERGSPENGVTTFTRGRLWDCANMELDPNRDVRRTTAVNK